MSGEFYRVEKERNTLKVEIDDLHGQVEHVNKAKVPYGKCSHDAYDTRDCPLSS